MAALPELQRGETARQGNKKKETLEADAAETDKEMESEVGEKVAGINIQRYKGLGEMNGEQLWETTLDPAVRNLQQVAIDDAKEADKMFDILMGGEVAPRKRFIQVHAASVKNLDV